MTTLCDPSDRRPVVAILHQLGGMRTYLSAIFLSSVLAMRPSADGKAFIQKLRSLAEKPRRGTTESISALSVVYLTCHPTKLLIIQPTSRGSGRLWCHDRGREMFRKNLDRDGAIKTRAASLVDLPHTSSANRREDLVRAETSVRRERHNCSESFDQCTASPGVENGVGGRLTASAPFRLSFRRALFRFGLGAHFLRPAHRLTSCREAFLQRLDDVHDRSGRG